MKSIVERLEESWSSMGATTAPKIDRILKERLEAADEIKRLTKALNTPEVDDFARGVVSEAQHQRARFAADHDAGKEPEDWFWLIGYLVGKALHAHKSGGLEKAKHHTISAAAALANWHAAASGESTEMRPGIAENKRP